MKRKAQAYLEHVIDARIWNTDVVVMVGLNEPRISAGLLRRKVPSDAVGEWLGHLRDVANIGGACTMSSHDAPGYVFVFFPEIKRDVEFSAGVAHELFHATCRILSRKGVRLVRDSEEAYAYTLEYLSREFWRWAVANGEAAALVLRRDERDGRPEPGGAASCCPE